MVIQIEWHSNGRFGFSGYRLDRPRIGADDGDLLVDQPVRDRLAGAGAALVVLVVELLPEPAVPGVEEHGLALPGFPDPLHAQGA
jgi:hypothetical protein